MYFLFFWWKALVVGSSLSSIQLFYKSLSLFITETLNHNGKIDDLTVIAHKPNVIDISSNIKKIYAKKSKTITVYSGELDLYPKYHNESHADEFKFKEQCTDYFESYFETLANKHSQVLPWKLPDKYKRIIESMDHWCRKTNKMLGIKGLVLHSFSILNHLLRHGFTKEMLQDYLNTKIVSDESTIIVYNPQESVLLLLRRAKSKKLATEIELVFNDLKLFMLLFYDILANSGMKLVPLVVTDEKVNPENLIVFYARTTCFQRMILQTLTNILCGG